MMRRSLFVAALLGVGCGGTNLRVQVVSAHDRRPVVDASVLLYERSDAPCLDKARAGELTDERGQAEITASFCGISKLWVSADGYERVLQPLDSCETSTLLVPLKVVPKGTVSSNCVEK